MHLPLAQWAADYGYWAVFIGALLEGETILLLAGFAAQQGSLSVAGVLGLAFAGAVLGDQVFFFVGRRFGIALLDRRDAWRARAEQVASRLRRHHGWVIVGVRFAYGLRIVGPIVIGASAVPPRSFLAFNALGAAIWAPLVFGTGYLFGQSLGWVMARLGAFEGVALVGVAVVLGAIFLARRRRQA